MTQKMGKTPTLGSTFSYLNLYPKKIILIIQLPMWTYMAIRTYLKIIST